MKIGIVRPKYILLFSIFLLLNHFTGLAQSTDVPKEIFGENFRSWLKAEWYNDYQNISFNKSKGYAKARLAMYNEIDNFNDTLYCLYSNLAHVVPPQGYNSAGNALPFNCEHIVPQSFFDQMAPMRNDIHHLAPTYDKWNGTRGSFPFAENNDEQTQKWMYLDKSINCNNATPCIPTEMLDAYSELISNKNESTFEPKEDAKGNVARSIFYFFTVYPNYNINLVGDIKTLYDWHLEDPVNEKDEARNDAIAAYQGNHNPYISNPNWVYRAWVANSVTVGHTLPSLNALETKLTYTFQGQLILNINNPNSEWLNINIHNIYGEVVHQFSTTQKRYTKDIAELKKQFNKGLSLMRITTETKSLKTYLFYLL